MKFDFATDAMSQEFCERIVRAMVFLYDFAPEDALAIINAHWKGQDILGNLHLVYHEIDWYWAETLGNPNPYQEANSPEQIAWKQREDEAQRRLATLPREPYDLWPEVPE